MELACSVSPDTVGVEPVIVSKGHHQAQYQKSIKIKLKRMVMVLITLQSPTTRSITSSLNSLFVEPTGIQQKDRTTKERTTL
jgi:hypothetical protein